MKIVAPSRFLTVVGIVPWRDRFPAGIRLRQSMDLGAAT